jgi:hypothetical protein
MTFLFPSQIKTQRKRQFSMLSSNYSVTQLFLEHKVKIFDTVDNNISFYIKPPSAKEILTDDSYQFIYYLSTLTEDEFAKKVGLPNTKNLYEFINKILKVYGQYAEFSDVLRRISSFMSNTFEDTIKVNTNGELIISPSIIITEEI